jgi:hypothetical protein
MSKLPSDIPQGFSRLERTNNGKVRDELTDIRENCIMRSFRRILLAKHNYNDKVKENEMMDRAYSTNGEKRNAYRRLMGKPERKRPLGRPRRMYMYIVGEGLIRP